MLTEDLQAIQKSLVCCLRVLPASRAFRRVYTNSPIDNPFWLKQTFRLRIIRTDRWRK